MFATQAGNPGPGDSIRIIHSPGRGKRTAGGQENHRPVLSGFPAD